MNGWAGFWIALALFLVFSDNGSALKIYVNNMVTAEKAAPLPNVR